MNFSNLLGVSINTIIETQLNNVPITGVTKLVSFLIKTFSFGGFIAIGILIFSLILKILPLPLDIFSRASTKKNALKMEKMRPQLERLQKQYANNKQLYNQKMMALYKKEGYSTFSACLPTLITLIFFIIVISAFNKYSTYTNLETFNEMARSYNYSISTQVDSDDDNYVETTKVDGKITKFEWSTKYAGKTDDELKEILNTLKEKARDDAAETYFKESKKAEFLWVKNIWIADLPWKKAFVQENEFDELKKYTNGLFGRKTVETSLSKYDYVEITSSTKLDKVKSERNGYLGLVVLSIVSMLVSQLVLTKGQKAQMELQSVDGANGQAATTAKMMTWMMPIIFGIFSFFYSAAFSIYLIISTLFSMLSTMVINKIVEKKFTKKVELEEQEKQNARFKHLSK